MITILKHLLLIALSVDLIQHAMMLYNDKTEKLGGQWLGFGFCCHWPCSILVWGTINKIPQAVNHSQNKNREVNIPKRLFSLANISSVTLAIYLAINCLNHKGMFPDAIPYLPVMVSVHR